MDLNVKAEKLQSSINGALLYIGTDTLSGNNNNEMITLLYNNLEPEQSFNDGKIADNGTLKACAVVRLENLSRETITKAAAEAARWAQQQEQVNVCLAPFNAEDSALIAEVFALAFGNAVYRFECNKKETKPAKLTRTVFFSEQHSQSVQKAIQSANALLYALNLCKDLGNAAPNKCTPAYLAEVAKAEAEKLGAEVKILSKKYIKKYMTSFWAVAKGSKQDPYLIELSYFGASDKNDAPTVLVGKGITFDSGGISLKPGLNMDEMKYDMCGAASVIGTFCAAVKLQLPINLVAIVPTCENMPSGNANKPGDVIKSMKGLTIEVLNTDAEGRLILCDALTYAEQFKPKAVIDVATLTGACIVALGHDVSGLMGNNQELVDSLLAASRESGDTAWQLPLLPTYKEQLKSNFADLPNIGTYGAGTITAGTFLSYFTEDYPWAHLDVAGTAWKSGKDKGATGRPIPLLLAYLKNLK